MEDYIPKKPLLASRDSHLSNELLALLFIGLLSNNIGQAFVYAVLPPLGRSVGLSEIRITAIISMSALIVTLTAPIWGKLSDKSGRKPIILIGILGYSIGSLAFASVFNLAKNGLISGLLLFVLALLVRSFQAATMSATNPGCMAYAADHTSADNRTKTLARLTSASSIGMILGPVLAGIFAHLGLLTPLVAASFLSAIAAVIIVVKLPNSRTSVSTGDRSKRANIGYFDCRVRPYITSAIGAFTGFAMLQQTLAFRLQDDFGLTGAETAQYTGWAMMTSASAMLLIQLVVSQRSIRPPMDLVRWGAGLLAGGTLAISFLSSWASILGSMLLVGSGLGLLMPAVASGASLAVNQQEQGGVAGLVAACPAAGFVIGPLVGGALYQYSAPSATLVAALILVIVFFSTLTATVELSKRSSGT